MVNALKKKNKVLTAAIIIAAIVIVNIVVAVVYRPIGPALTVDKYLKGYKIERILERKYKDDDFTLVKIAVEREDLLIGFQPYGYSYEFKSKRFGNETFYVYTDFEYKSVDDNYLDLRYKNEARKLIEKCLDAYFIDGHYCYYIYDYDDSDEAFFLDTYAKTPDIYYYAGQRCCSGLRIIVDSNFSTKNQDKIQDDIKDNITSSFDIKTTGIDIRVLFDKKDEMAIPKGKNVPSSEFYNYRDLNYWEKSLEIKNTDSKDNTDYTLNCEWKINDKDNFSYKTKNKFLNGAKVSAVIDGYEFSLDGSVTLNEVLKKTGFVYYNLTREENSFKPDKSVDIGIGEKDFGVGARVYLVNKNKQNAKIENCKLYGVSIGSVFTVDTDEYSNYSVCGLKIGDTLTEKDIVNRFGPYEEKKTLNNGDIAYYFVDGTVTGYATANDFQRKLNVVFRGDVIRTLYCSYYEPDNNYSFSSYD